MNRGHKTCIKSEAEAENDEHARPTPFVLNGGQVMAIPTGCDQPDLQMDNPGAAAIDIGSTVHMAAVNLLSGHMPVQALADWFANLGATSVAMEATGMKIIRRSCASKTISCVSRG